MCVSISEAHHYPRCSTTLNIIVYQHKVERIAQKPNKNPNETCTTIIRLAVDHRPRRASETTQVSVLYAVDHGHTRSTVAVDRDPDFQLLKF